MELKDFQTLEWQIYVIVSIGVESVSDKSFQEGDKFWPVLKSFETLHFAIDVVKWSYVL